MRSSSPIRPASIRSSMTSSSAPDAPLRAGGPERAAIRPGSVSAIVITLNEERNIGECLDTLRWADEVIVVDSRSTDKTAQIARGRGATVIAEPWAGYGQARNLAALRASGEWILAIDADERVPEALSAEIRAIAS